MIKCRITERAFSSGSKGWRVEYKPGIFFWHYDDIYWSLADAQKAVLNIKRKGRPGEKVIYCE